MSLWCNSYVFVWPLLRVDATCSFIYNINLLSVVSINICFSIKLLRLQAVDIEKYVQANNKYFPGNFPHVVTIRLVQQTLKRTIF